MLPLVDGGAQLPLDAPPEGVGHLADEGAVDAQLIPGELVDDDHWPLHFTAVEGLPEVALLRLDGERGNFHIARSEVAEDLLFLGIQLHVDTAFRSNDFLSPLYRIFWGRYTAFSAELFAKIDILGPGCYTEGKEGDGCSSITDVRRSMQTGR